MSQTVQLQNNSLSNVQTYLIKYCWSNLTNLQDETRELIALCTDDILLIQLSEIFDNYIMPYYYEDRTSFNKLREHFVKFMNLCLKNQTVYGLSPYSFLLRYDTLCKMTNISFQPSLESIMTKLIKKAKSEITRLT